MDFTGKMNSKLGSSYSFDGHLPPTASLWSPSPFMSASESVHPKACVITYTTQTLWLTELCSAFTPQRATNTRQWCGADFY